MVLRHAEGGLLKGVPLWAYRWVIGINTADGELALKRLGRTLYEAACMFYLDDACRRLAVHQERRNPAPQTSSKVAFKVCLRTFPCLPRSWHIMRASISAWQTAATVFKLRAVCRSSHGAPAFMCMTFQHVQYLPYMLLCQQPFCAL